MNAENNRWKISHFVLIGLMAAIYAAVIYGVGMLTSVTIPIMHVFAPSMTGILMGPIILFVVKTVRRFGALTLLAGLGVALFTLTGMGSINCLIFVVIAGLISDVIITKTGFKTLSIAAGHGLTQAAYFGGGVFPFIFFLERELAKWQEMGMSLDEIRECTILYRCLCCNRTCIRCCLRHCRRVYRQAHLKTAF